MPKLSNFVPTIIKTVGIVKDHGVFISYKLKWSQHEEG